jgi:hypothetical protein
VDEEDEDDVELEVASSIISDEEEEDAIESFEPSKEDSVE